MRLQADAFAQYGEVHEADAIMLMLQNYKRMESVSEGFRVVGCVMMVMMMTS